MCFSNMIDCWQNKMEYTTHLLYVTLYGLMLQYAVAQITNNDSPSKELQPSQKRPKHKLAPPKPMTDVCTRLNLQSIFHHKRVVQTRLKNALRSSMSDETTNLNTKNHQKKVINIFQVYFYS